MRLKTNDQLVRYLLGDLSEDEQQHIEDEYFADDSAWEKLEAIEADLIDSYVRGDLTTEQRKQFEKNFLASPDKRERVAVATHLLNPIVRKRAAGSASGDSSQPASSWKTPWRMLASQPASARWAAAAMMLMLFATIVMLTVWNRRLHTELAQVQSRQNKLQKEVETLRRQTPDTNIPKNNKEDAQREAANFMAQQPSVISIMLRPGSLRSVGKGNEGPVVAIRPAPSSVMLVLDLERDDYSQYAASLRTAEGKEIRHLEGLKSKPTQNGGRAVMISIPSELLSKHEYIVKLSGLSADGQLELVDFYNFSVTR